MICIITEKNVYLTQFVQNSTLENHVFDLVLATNDELIETFNVGDLFSNSDHHEITFDIKFMADVSNKNSGNYAYQYVPMTNR